MVYQGSNIECKVERGKTSVEGGQSLFKDTFICHARKFRLPLRDAGDPLQDLDFRMSILRAFWSMPYFSR